MRSIKNAKGLLAAILLIVTSFSSIYSQDLNSAYFIDNYLYSYRLNPAFIPKQNFVGALISNVNAGSHSNVGLSTFFYPQDDGDLMTFLHPDVGTDQFLSKLHATNKIMVNANYNIGSLGYKTKYFNHDAFQTFEINMRHTTSAMLPYGLFSFLKADSNDDFLYDLSHVYGTTVTYLELAGGAALQFGDLQIGARGKLLVGTHKVRMRVKSMFANLSGEDWSMHSKADLTAAGGGIKFKTKEGALGGYDMIDMKGIKFKPIGLGGLGAAIDLGVSYKVNDYIKVSAAVNDLGYIVWKNKVSGFNSGNTWIVPKDDIPTEGIGGIGTVFKDAINQFKSVYEFLPCKNRYSYQFLTYNAHAGVEFIMPFYKKMSVGVLGSLTDSNIYRYREVRLSLNAAPLSWLSLSVNTAYTSLGWEYGGVITFNTPWFNFFVGTDSYYFKMTPQFIPVDQFNTNLVFGFNYVFKSHPFKKRR